MYVSEDRLVKESCGPESLRFGIESTENLITTLRPYIHGHIKMREASTSPYKQAQGRLQVSQGHQRRR